MATAPSRRRSAASSSDPVALLMELLALPGPSGGEQAVAAYLIDRLRAAGAPEGAFARDNAHKKTPLAGAAGNLALRLPGTRRGPRRLLVAHMDTVPICAGARPVRRGERIESVDAHTGLGGDNRTGCAVLLHTALALLAEGTPHPPLTFLWTVQEEAGLHGARHVRLAMLRSPRLAFNWDGGPANRVTIGATGGYRMDIAVRGVASHAGVHPERGVSAIAIASVAIADLTRSGWHGLIERASHRGTSNVGVIHGGAATNIVTDLVQLRAEARSHDKSFRTKIIRKIERAFAAAAKEVRNVDGVRGQVEIRGQLDYEAFRLPLDEPAVVAAAAALDAEGLETDYAVANGGLDANWLTQRGIPTVTLGCGQNAIHTADEWVNVEEFERACRVAQRIATAKN